LIGINYFGQDGELKGCINDVRNVSAFLIERYGYRREDMVTLTDDERNPVQQPTKQNIIRAMQWLVEGARANDALFLHYSGERLPRRSFLCPRMPGIQPPDHRVEQVTAARRRTSTATNRTAPTRPYTRSTTSGRATSSTTRSTTTSSSRWRRACD